MTNQLPTIAVVNGPNLNLLGSREPQLYGSESFAEFLPKLAGRFPQCRIDYFQSNIEGELVGFLQKCRHSAAGVVLNAAAYTHTSIAIADAVAAIEVPVVEVHISNVLAREDYRKTSFIAAKCVGSISGLGLVGYELAVEYLLRRLDAKSA